jgi:NADPH:quinone reductase-like Zn-dependent oxidoreductase
MFGTASAAKHGIVAQYGATPIDYRNDDFVQVLAATAPEGMDAVFDPIGGDNWRRSFDTLGRNGRFIGYGFTSVLGEGERDEWADGWKTIAQTKITDKGHSALVYSITSLHKERPDWFAADVGALFSLLETRAIHPLIAHRLPLAEAGQAHRLLQDASSVGKVVLIGT